MSSILPYVMVAGSAFGAYSQYRGGQQAAEIGRQSQAALYSTAADNEAIAIENAKIAEAEAQAIEKKGAADVALKQKEIDALLAFQRTTETKTGFKYAGTPEWVAAESLKEGKLDTATIWSNALTASAATRAKGRVIAMQGSRAAVQLRTQGDITVQQGINAASAGSINAVGTLLGGVSSAYIASQYPSLVTPRVRQT